jgi:3-hydroxybutyryl-CoA dehydrogenase
MIERAVVIGAGQMGNGIAHTLALASIPVTMVDVSEDALTRGRTTIGANLDRQVKKGTIPRDVRDATFARIGASTDLSAAGNADIVIEAASENAGLKFDLFKRLDAIAPPSAILASNTSSISITEIAAKTRRPA